MLLREPFDKEIDGKVFTLHKFTVRAGREIMSQYPLSAIPKLGDYTVNETLALKIMNFVAVKTDAGTMIPLTTWDLIDNHVPSWEAQFKIELAMVEYNFHFFQQGGVSTLLEGFTQMLPQWIAKILTQWSQLSSQTEKPLSENSRSGTRLKKGSTSTK